MPVPPQLRVRDLLALIGLAAAVLTPVSIAVRAEHRRRVAMLEQAEADALRLARTWEERAAALRRVSTDDAAAVVQAALDVTRAEHFASRLRELATRDAELAHRMKSLGW